MKRIVSLMLVIVILFSLSVVPVFAGETAEDIVLTEFWNDISANKVGVKGTVNAGGKERNVSIRVVEAGKSFEEALKNVKLLQHIFMVKTNSAGNFEYEFELYRKSINDKGIFDVYITADNSDCVIKKTVSCNWSADLKYIAEKSIVFKKDNENVIVYGNREVMQTAPVIKDNTVYIDADFAAQYGCDRNAAVLIEGKKYTDINELKKRGHKIYIGKDIAAASLLDDIEAIDLLAVLFNNEDIVLNEFWSVAQDGRVKIKGVVNSGMGERSVIIRAVESGKSFEEALTNPELLQNVYMVKTNALGYFNYDFTVNHKTAGSGETYDIYITVQDSDFVIKKTVSCFSEESRRYVTDNSVIFCADNRNVIVNGEYAVMENVPVKKNSTLYIDEAFAVSCGLTGYTAYNIDGNSYVDISCFGKNVYKGNYVYIASDNDGITNTDAFLAMFGLYVSPYGNDNNSGYFNAPVQTVNKAVKLAENNKINGGCRIYVMNGEHSPEETIKIENTSDIKILNYADDKPVINGAVKLYKEDFEKVTDESFLGKLTRNAADKLVSLDLSKYGIDAQSMKTVGADSYYRLYEDGKKQMLSRYPNSKYENLVMAGESFSDGFYLGDNSRNWGNISNINLRGFVNNGFQLIKGFISSKNEETGAFTLPGDFNTSWNINGRACIAENVFEEIDVPGEWYIDTEKKMLYYYPAGNLENVELTLFDNDVISVGNAQNIEICGLELKNSNGSGISIKNSSNVTIDKFKLHGMGKRGVEITDSKDSVVKNSEIFDLGRDGVYISCGNRPKLINGNCGAENCHIYNFSDKNYNMSAVSLNGVGNYAKHNVMHDSMSQGVLFAGNDHVIDNNEIYNVVRDVHDAGAIYAGGMNGQIGNTITNNYIHDILKSGSEVFAVYLDDGFSGTTVKGNVITNVVSGGLFGGGRNNTITNNLLFDTRFRNYDRRMEWGQTHRNINEQYYDKGLIPSISIKEKTPDYDEEKWIERYGDMWTSIVGDGKKDYDYRQGTSDEEFDAGLPRYVNVTDNLVISHNKSIALSPLSVDWTKKSQNTNKTLAVNPNYETTYENNLGILRATPYSLDDSASLDYTVNKSGYYIMLDTDGLVEPGELYKVTARLYGKKVQSEASVQIASASSVNSNWPYYPFKLFFDDNGEQSLNNGEWTDVSCYWMPHANNNPSARGRLIKISFPKSSIGDVYSVGNISFEKVMYSDVKDKMPSPTMEETGAGEYKYPVKRKIDLSETESLLKIGSTTRVKAYSIEEVFTENTTDEDSRTTVDEMKLVPTELTEGLTYTSSNTSVAEVDESGNITAKAEGFAKITVTDGTNSSSVMITCYTNKYNGIKFNGDCSTVHDYDPVYSNEAIRTIGTESVKTNVTAKDGVKISFRFYDTGALADKLDSSENLCFGIKASNSRLDGYNGAGCIGISDMYGGGKYRFTNNATEIRSAGWHQVYGVMKPSGTDGYVRVDWYLDGVLATASENIPVGEDIYLYYRMAKNAYPQWFKNVYVVGESSVDVGNITETIHTDKIIIDASNGKSEQWSTESDNCIKEIYENDNALKTDDYLSWFRNADNGDFAITAPEELAAVMPQFEPIDFDAIGNTGEIYSGLAAPDLQYPINSEETGKTVQIEWSEPVGASEYTIKISQDRDMSEVIMTKTVITNTATVTLPDDGMYYYTVTARNLSKRYKCEATSKQQSFCVTNELKLSEVKTEALSDTEKKAMFEYSVSDGSITGKAILVEKNSNGKVVGVVIEDIPEAIDNKITLSGELSNDNVMECYLWNDIRLMKPYVAKASTLY